MIFVDTSAWFAASVPKDPNHRAAKEFMAATDSILLVTTDYVLDEYLTLLKSRGQLQRLNQLGRQILEEVVCRIEWVQAADVYKAWTIFNSHRDKGWSFTDCVSRTVMERLKIAQAFAFDDHFREFGSISVVP
ncbi:MAG: PIN domain-containing protein [Pirellulales bacterium]